MVAGTTLALLAGFAGPITAHSAGPAPALTFPPSAPLHIDSQAAVRIIGCEPDGTLVADRFGDKGTVVTSTDQMRTWTAQGHPNTTQGLPRMLFRTRFGGWLVNADHYMFRSGDQGRTWQRVLDLGGAAGLLPQEITQDSSGMVYLAPYGLTLADYPNGVIRVFQSFDDGFTWQVQSTFQTSMALAFRSAPSAVRHVHAIESLPSGLWLTTGDQSGQAEIWRWGGDRWIRASPLDKTLAGQRWRTVSLQQRGDRMYWARDSGGSTLGEVGWAPVSNLAAYHSLTVLPTGVLYSAQLSDGTLLFSGSLDGGIDLDPDVDLWAVDPQDAVTKVWGAARFPFTARTPFPQITNMCVEPDGKHFAFSAEYVAATDGPAGPNYSVSYVAHIGNLPPLPLLPAAAASATPLAGHAVAAARISRRAIGAVGVVGLLLVTIVVTLMLRHRRGRRGNPGAPPS
jgi:hypothetical protein